MKKIAILVAFCALLGACNQNRRDDPYADGARGPDGPDGPSIGGGFGGRGGSGGSGYGGGAGGARDLLQQLRRRCAVAVFHSGSETRATRGSLNNLLQQLQAAHG
jgi:hypothetical protein